MQASRRSTLRSRARVADAELVTFGIGHEEPVGAVLFERVGLEPAGAKRGEAVGLGFYVRDMDVEMHPVLGRLRFGDSLQQQLRAVTFGGQQHHVAAGAADVGVAERRRPELGQRLRIGTVQTNPMRAVIRVPP